MLLIRSVARVQVYKGVWNSVCTSGYVALAVSAARQATFAEEQIPDAMQATFVIAAVLFVIHGCIRLGFKGAIHQNVQRLRRYVAQEETPEMRRTVDHYLFVGKLPTTFSIFDDLR